MSLILDALKKSERERRAGQVPGLPSLATQETRTIPRWVYGVVGLLVLANLSLLAYWLLTRPPSSAPATVPAGDGSSHPAAAQDHPATQALANVGPPPTPTAPQPVTAPGTEGGVPASIMPTPTSPPVMVQPSADPAILPPERAATLSDVPARTLMPQRPAIDAEEAEIDAELEQDGELSSRTASLAEASEGRPRAGIEPGIPALHDLSPDFQSRVQPFRITMFAYAQNPAERFVIIDMKKYRVGDQLPGGLLLLGIQAEYLVLELDGQKFQLPRI